jgi:hypothetical protein
LDVPAWGSETITLNFAIIFSQRSMKLDALSIKYLCSFFSSKTLLIEVQFVG